MEIKIGIGLDDIIFGISMSETRSIIGEPDNVSETEKINGIVYYYNKLMLKTKFDKTEGSRLYSIEVYNPEVFMFNQKIINMDKSDLIYLLNLNGYKKLRYEDYDYFETLFCEEIWTTFSFEFNRIENVEFSPLIKRYKNNSIILWPKL